MPLRVENLSKRYSNIWALRDVTFEVIDGEIFGIFGGTGSGKTSLLRAVVGLEKVNGGSIFVDEKDISSLAAISRTIYLSESRTTAGRSSIFGRNRDTSSAGETQIKVFQRAIENDEPILLFDEPLAVVDAVHRGRLLGDLRRLAADGRMIIFASSDFERIASICDRVAVIINGEIAQIGFPQQVYENPESVAVAKIVGRNNLFTARRLTSTNADLPEFLTIDGGHKLFAQATEKRFLGAINQNVHLAIRPEHISIAFGASFPEDNLLRAVVTTIKFLGETTLINLDADGLNLEARVFRVVGLNVGEECMIGMPPYRIQVLKS